ncbi:MAG: TonB-dependent receptor, partial [Arenimonas sp.]|nr:TonB-dependent receptor [Arenimonas sp.]
MFNTTFRKHGLALAISAAVFAPITFAQESADKEKDSAGMLDSVQVTADHRVENIQDVPVSISTISGEQLEAIKAGGEDVRVLSARIPSLYIESSFGRTFPRFYIRGLGNSDFDLNASQPVSLILDDVVQESPMLKGFPMFDIEQVEVFRGPQGTMFGRNTPAGVVKFSSVKPSDEVSGYGLITVGSYDSVNLEGAIGGSLGNGWSARLSGLSQHRGDYVDNTFTGQKNALEGYNDQAIRGQLMYVSDDFEALFNVHARDLEGTARLFRAGMIEKGTNHPVAGFDRDKVSIDGLNEQTLNQFGAMANLRWDFDNLSLISITGYETVDAYSRGDIDGGSIYTYPTDELNEALFPAQSADGLPNHEQFTQELRLQSQTGGKFEWQTGLYYFNEDIVIDSFNYDTFTTEQNGYARQTQSNDAWAIYASGDYKFTDAFSMRAGLRYTQDEKHFTAERTDSPFCPPGACDAYPDPVNTSAPHTSWDISGIYAVNESVNLY